MIEIVSTDYINKKDILCKLEEEYQKYQRLMLEHIDKNKELAIKYKNKRDAIEDFQNAILKENN